MTNRKNIIFESLVTKVAKFLDNISCLILLLMMFLGAADVAGRYLFNRPITGVKEADVLLLLGIVVLSLAYTQTLNQHITVDIITSHLPPRAKSVQRLFVLLISLALFMAVIWQGTKLAITYWQSNREVVFFHIPLAPFQIIILLGVFLLCLVFIVQIISVVRGTWRGN